MARANEQQDIRASLRWDHPQTLRYEVVLGPVAELSQELLEMVPPSEDPSSNLRTPSSVGLPSGSKSLPQ